MRTAASLAAEAVKGRSDCINMHTWPTSAMPAHAAYRAIARVQCWQRRSSARLTSVLTCVTSYSTIMPPGRGGNVIATFEPTRSTAYTTSPAIGPSRQTPWHQRGASACRTTSRPKRSAIPVSVRSPLTSVISPEGRMSCLDPSAAEPWRITPIRFVTPLLSRGCSRLIALVREQDAGDDTSRSPQRSAPGPACGHDLPPPPPGRSPRQPAAR